jgi:apolipoprotein N-acyltransferase
LLLFGISKTNFVDSQSETVKVAAIVLIPQDGKAVTMDKIWTEKSFSPFEETVSKIEDLIKIAALNGAKIISSQEHAITIPKKDEEKLKEEYQRIAKENNVYLSITYSYYSIEEKGENKHLLINNNGEIKLDYAKRYLLGLGSFGETGVFNKGPEIIQSLDTPYGKIGISTCRDMDFLSFIRQAGKADVDIMFSPSYDWPKSKGPSYQLRTIENGFSFVRPTYNGISFAADYDGKILAQMDSDKTSDGIMYANVPIKGIKTIYSIIGDLLGWLCVVGMFGFIILSTNKREIKLRKLS